MVLPIIVGGYVVTRTSDSGNSDEIMNQVGFNHPEKYNQIHGGKGTGQLVDSVRTWKNDIAADFDEVANLIEDANKQAGVVWTGQAAEAHNAASRPMSQFAMDAQQVSDAVGSSAEAQVGNFSRVRDSMPEPVEVTATDNMLEKGGAWLTGSETDLQQQERQATAKAQEAKAHYDTYSNGVSSVNQGLPHYPKAPEMTYAPGDAQPHGKATVGSGNGYTGSGLSSDTSTVGGGSSVAAGSGYQGSFPHGSATGVDPASGSGSGVGGGASAGTGSPAGSGSAWSPSPGGAGAGVPGGAGVGGSGGAGTPGGISGGVIGAPGVGGGSGSRGGSGVGGGSGGRGGTGVGSGGRGATGVGGGSGGRGATGVGGGSGGGSGAGGRSGFGAGGRAGVGGLGGGSGSGVGGGSGSGVGSGSGGNNLGAGGRAGTGGLGGSGSTGGGVAGGAGARGGMGGGAMAPGARGRGAPGEDDQEHENKYMLDTDEAWEDLGLPPVAPAVFGDWDNDDR
ncbi:PPE domain-containing protein [Allosaccharopolyspora coralli]|uniref:PPE domain-containing protein n=1 Tax=Allosaccharopolyspora coralli TaxID=2665642 RepID=A0A5Q3QCQ1_9PSEU|nr:PPE domain-containing protein [Allosaccharopolyspora coralli]QGK68577.1 PPE domain-containing protein [Allosaccharopolyspora coralli]